MKMTLDKVREVVRGYQAEGFDPANAAKMSDELRSMSTPSLDRWNDVFVRHISYMLAEIMKMCDEGRTEKVMRWLGFVQGVLWCMGLRTLGELKAENMLPVTSASTLTCTLGMEYHDNDSDEYHQHDSRCYSTASKTEVEA